MRRQTSRAIILAFLTTGCAKESPPTIVQVEGVVLLDNVPLYNVEVRFYPMVAYGAEYMAKGVTDKQGRFKLTCKGQPGACAGENRVVLTEPDVPRHLLGEDAQADLVKYRQSLGLRPPEKYGNLAESPLVVEVKAEQKEYDFRLNR
jgi:hypothetical protein